jgi:hypothetical protein
MAYLDNNTVELARNTDIITFLEKYSGFDFINRGGAYRCKQHPSLAVKDDRHSFYWHSQGVGGFGPLDYLMKVEKMAFREAMGVIALISFNGRSPTLPKPAATIPQPSKTLILPEKAGVPLLLYDYLCKRRGIDSEVVNGLIQKESLYEDIRGNIVFVGFDEQGKARFASVRGTHGDYRGDCAGSDKRYGFTITACTPSEHLYIFESPIDAMSHASLTNAATGNKSAWEQHNRLSLAGTGDTAIPFFLNQHKTVRELVFCLDNDPTGLEVAATLITKYADKGYTTRIERPKGKDFNVDLLEYRQSLPKKAHRYSHDR